MSPVLHCQILLHLRRLHIALEVFRTGLDVENCLPSKGLESELRKTRYPRTMVVPPFTLCSLRAFPFCSDPTKEGNPSSVSVSSGSRPSNLVEADLQLGPPSGLSSPGCPPAGSVGAQVNGPVRVRAGVAVVRVRASPQTGRGRRRRGPVPPEGRERGEGPEASSPREPGAEEGREVESVQTSGILLFGSRRRSGPPRPAPAEPQAPLGPATGAGECLNRGGSRVGEGRGAVGATK